MARGPPQEMYAAACREVRISRIQRLADLVEGGDRLVVTDPVPPLRAAYRGARCTPCAALTSCRLGDICTSGAGTAVTW
jgi:hypothetical protein